MHPYVYNMDGYVLFFAFLGQVQVGDIFKLTCWNWQVSMYTPQGETHARDVHLPWNGVLMTDNGQIQISEGRPNLGVAREVLASMR